jgi:biotin carboxyl carrier protein
VSEPTLTVRVERDGEGHVRVLAPAAGWWSEPPTEGAPVGPGSAVGRLRVLTRRFRLLLPEGPMGVVERGPRGGSRAVGFGEPLLTLRESTRPRPTPDRAAAAACGEDLPAGCHAVRSPTEGLFYRRPAPDAIPFVDVGSPVARGEPVGLVEVMKTFNHVLYGGEGLPETARVVEVRCEDGVEVRAGQILLVVR